MPDGSAPPNSFADPFASQFTGPEWARMGGLTADHDLVALQAAARFAELAVEAATRDAINEAHRPGPAKPRDSADPLDQVAADWAARTDADEKIIHAFLGIEDPIGREADTAFVEADVDATLAAFLDHLPDSLLEDGELAALDAFDKALVSGSDAAEALSAAILAAEQIDASASVAAALARTPPDRSLGLETASLDAPETDAPAEAPTAPPAPAPFISALPAGTFSGFALGSSSPRDAAFGFGFQFAPKPLEVFVPAAHGSADGARRTEPQIDDSPTYTPIIGTSVADFLVGTASRDAIGGRESDDYIYADQPTNYDPSLHDAAHPLTVPTFSASGGDDVVAGGGGDDVVWGGGGNDLMHGDVPDTSQALFAEFSFSLGADVPGDDSLYGGDGNDSLWGGDGDDVLAGEAGDDLLYGDAGADTLSGGAGNDNLFGYAGDDILRGGAGNDTLAGGDGADVFAFADGSGTGPAERVASLGVDTITDYSAADGDSFTLSDADFGLGNTGVLTDAANYFEIADGTLSDNPFDISGGASGSALLVMGSNSGSDGVGLYFTEDASQASNLNSYQIADIISVNASDFEAADFLLNG